jgi:hypothetical protein
MPQNMLILKYKFPNFCNIWIVHDDINSPTKELQSPPPQVAKEPTSETFAIIRLQGTHIIARDTYIVFGGF